MSESPPVLLVHGINDTAGVFWRMAAYLRDRGCSTHALDLTPNNGAARLEVLAQQVADRATRLPAGPFDLVGFSMGGLIGRYYLQRLGGSRRVRRFISISAPNRGTWLAYLTHLPGCQQMRPQSQFLKDLNGDLAWLKQVETTVFWTPFDLMILPAWSSVLPGVTSTRLPVALHPCMLTDRRCCAAVAAALTS
ncbi:putative acetyltransferase and hydrolase [Rubidibacter lacunae KORDI 51-2]|uniref:Putative acetyltransferase and hydrolase n=1 Tax=Rubidibacter lacunae KORDI 51-2 TaxID=582515 RepID=U5DGS2_9CHRO|nr:alpha/beta fold hydrolase [Rubidibacter lacunae]ERN40801.1 putative acetyltransferase and hydrolase [Rubidibacter lacunae KORDI 51-2]